MREEGSRRQQQNVQESLAPTTEPKQKCIKTKSRALHSDMKIHLETNKRSNDLKIKMYTDTRTRTHRSNGRATGWGSNKDLLTQETLTVVHLLLGTALR